MNFYQGDAHKKVSFAFLCNSQFVNVALTVTSLAALLNYGIAQVSLKLYNIAHYTDLEDKSMVI